MRKSKRPAFDPATLPVFPKGTPVEIIRPNIHAGHSGIVGGMTQEGKHIVRIPLHNPTPVTTHWSASAWGDELIEAL